MQCELRQDRRDPTQLFLISWSITHTTRCRLRRLTASTLMLLGNYVERIMVTVHISQRGMTAEPFQAMSFGQRASELQAQGHDVIRLSLGEPDFGAPPAVREAMREVMDGRALPYTAALGLPELRERIADFYRQRHKVEVDPRRVIITSGASAALLVVIAATVDPGDSVLMADPSYPCNRALVESFGGSVLLAPTTERSRFQLTVDTVADTWTATTTAVMMASPANPTGTSIPTDEMHRICGLARDRQAWTISDEIYLDLADHNDDGSVQPSALTMDDNAIVISSFSKYFGMTGWRLGWAILPENLVDAVERLAVNYFLCASTPAQFAALSCFTPESLEICEQRRQELLVRRNIALTGLAEIGLPVSVKPNGAFYAYFDVSSTGLDAWSFCQRALDEHHVALTPGRDFSTTTSETHVRLSYAASRQDIAEGIHRLGEMMKQLTPTAI